jgi:pilus assembly protein CpaE
MPVYIWSADLNIERTKAFEDRVRMVVPTLVAISSLDEAFADSAKGLDKENYVLIVMPNRDKFDFSKFLDLALRHRERTFSILISDEIPIDDYKALLRTGGADWVSINSNPQEIVDVLSRRQATTVAEARISASPGRKAVAISFVPSAGGVGNSTLAVETGVHLKTNKATRERNICLVALDFQSSNVCDYLDIEPRLQIQEISTDPERLDAQLFDIFVSRHSSGLDVFAAPRTKFDYCNLAISALDTLFSIASTRYDLMLIDLPVTWFSWTSKIISASDAVVVTGTNNVPGLRQSVETLAAIRETAHISSKIAVAVNRCQRRLFGGIIRRHHVDATLGHERVFYVGEEPMALESINTGIPMALKKNYRMIGKEIAALAEFCADVKLDSVHGRQ